ncbi:DNA 5'-3' helicase [Plasmodiophora brassicae]|uniref:DNA 5'-3' helicase n=1 Tax=Plasmodiophora brassicae TaxID=37360 RepID=A0A3P3YLZ1_PLABS|nr:unnamed protein product [Plasmodiophora brassicae]
MRFMLGDLPVYFPYDRMYPEQLMYMQNLKRTLDGAPGGHCLLEMPTGTGKTVTLLSFITSYQLHCPSIGKLVYCTRTVQEMDKVMAELKVVLEYRDSYLAKEGQSAPPKGLAVCLSARRNMCIHPTVSQFDKRDKVDALCRNLTSEWVRAAHEKDQSVEVCGFYEHLQSIGGMDGDLHGVLSLDDLKTLGTERNWCPYFLARNALSLANIIVYNYQYIIDPKVSGMVSRALDQNAIIVFDEAHNIDSICIEALSVSLNKRTLQASTANLQKLSRKIQEVESVDAARLNEEYQRLVRGIANSVGGAGESGPILASPVLPADVLREAVPGNIRKAKHFIMFLNTVVQYFKSRLKGRAVVQETPTQFIASFETHSGMRSSQTNSLRFIYDRLVSLLRTLQISDLDEFVPLQLVSDFATLVGTYSKGFAVLMEPYNDRTPTISDPILRLVCLDASIAIKPVLEKFRNVIITSGTMSPLDLYPKLLNFTPKVSESFPMSLYSARATVCPLIVTKGNDQTELTSKFESRRDPSIVANFGKLLLELAQTVPDGMVCFFTSYAYLEEIVAEWDRIGILKQVLHHKLIFIETRDIVETSLALESFKRACDSGRGGVFLSIARGKVSEGIDFDHHYGRAVVLFGIPFQYTLSRVLRCRLQYLYETLNIREGDFLSFDAMRQASQCLGRVIRSKSDYGLMIFADQRYRRADKRTKLPRWVQDSLYPENVGLSVDRAISVSRDYLRRMGQPHSPEDELGETLLDEAMVTERASQQS